MKRALGFAFFASATAAQADSAPQTSYRIQVPVVAVDAVVEERRVSRPERHCSPVTSQARSYTRSDDRYGVDYSYNPRNEYRNDYYRAPRRQSYRENNLGAQILGGLIGGAIGNQFGKGNGRKALTIAGALVGSSVARDRNQSPRRYRDSYEPEYRREYQPEYECRTTHRERVIEEIIGYDVTYEYNGTTAVKRMDFDPGDTLELRVTASPVSTNSARRTL